MYKGNAQGINFDDIHNDNGYWIKTNDNVQGLPSDAAGHGVIVMFHNIQVYFSYDNVSRLSVSMRAYNLYVTGWGTWITMKNW